MMTASFSISEYRNLMSYVVNVTTGVTSWLLSVPNLDNVELEPRSFFFFKVTPVGKQIPPGRKKQKQKKNSVLAAALPHHPDVESVLTTI